MKLRSLYVACRKSFHRLIPLSPKVLSISLPLRAPRTLSGIFLGPDQGLTVSFIRTSLHYFLALHDGETTIAALVREKNCKKSVRARVSVIATFDGSIVAEDWKMAQRDNLGVFV